MPESDGGEKGHVLYLLSFGKRVYGEKERAGDDRELPVNVVLFKPFHYNIKENGDLQVSTYMREDVDDISKKVREI